MPGSPPAEPTPACRAEGSRSLFPGIRKLRGIGAQPETRGAGEGDGLTLVGDPEATADHGPLGAVAFHRAVSPDQIFVEFDMGALGRETISVVVEQLDMARQVDRPGGLIVAPCFGPDRDPMPV